MEGQENEYMTGHEPAIRMSFECDGSGESLEIETEERCFPGRLLSEHDKQARAASHENIDWQADMPENIP